MLIEYVGGRSGCQGERVARETSDETLYCSRFLWEEIWGAWYREPGCFNPAENYGLKAGGWWSTWSYWWDIMDSRNEWVC